LKWLELSAEVDRGQAETVAEEALRPFGQGGVAIEEEVSWGQAEEPLFQGRARVSVFLPVDDALGSKRLRLEEALSRAMFPRPVGLSAREIEEQQWETAWRKHYKVLKVGQRIIVKPAWEEYRTEAGQIVIEIEPGMAFGTGQHATTRLCLVAIERLLRPGMAVLDLGTGSGILAIAAAKLGASPVLALDVSPTSVAVARANIEANALSHLIAVEEGTLPQSGGVWEASFDLVAANVIADVIEDLSPYLVRSLKANGFLIAGGIIRDRLDGIVGKLEEAGVRVIDTLAEGEWRAVIAQAKKG